MRMLNYFWYELEVSVICDSTYAYTVTDREPSMYTIFVANCIPPENGASIGSYFEKKLTNSIYFQFIYFFKVV